MKKVLIYGLILMQLVIIVSLSRELRESLMARGRIGKLEERKLQLEEKQVDLQEDLKFVQSEFYVEQVARNELQLGKEGEEVVIIPDNSNLQDKNLNIELEGDIAGVRVGGVKGNWLKWWEVFFGQE